MGLAEDGAQGSHGRQRLVGRHAYLRIDVMNVCIGTLSLFVTSGLVLGALWLVGECTAVRVRCDPGRRQQDAPERVVLTATAGTGRAGPRSAGSGRRGRRG